MYPEATYITGCAVSNTCVIVLTYGVAVPSLHPSQPHTAHSMKILLVMLVSHPIAGPVILIHLLLVNILQNCPLVCPSFWSSSGPNVCLDLLGCFT